MRWRTLASSCALAATGCWVPNETGKQMQADIVALQQQARTIELERARLEERAKAQIDAVAEALAELRRASRTSSADFGVQIERLIKEVQELRGALELAEYRMGKLDGALSGEGSLAARLDVLEKKLKEATEKPPPEKPLDSKELLAQADKLAKDGKTSEARGILRDVVKRWPDTTGVSDEAYFALGELYLREKKHNSAVQEYVKVVEKFAGGKRVADALYQIGVCSLELGNLEDAQIFLGEIVKTHKKSPRFKDAQAKLDEVTKRLEREKKQPKKDAKDAKAEPKKGGK